MDLSRLRDFFGLRPASPSAQADARNEALDHYCNNFKDFLTQAGYEIAHGSDYEYFRAHSPALHRRKLSEGMIRHFNNVARFAKNGNPAAENTLIDLTSNMNGYVHRTDRIVCLPDEEGLVERMAAANGLDAARLRKAGLTDQYLYAYVLIHEGCHVTGNEVSWTDSNFTSGEFQTHAAGFARFLQATELEPDHPVPKLITAFFSSFTLGGALKSGTDNYAYSWIDKAYDWISSNWQKRENFWDEDRGTFLPQIYEQFDYFGNAKKSEAAARPFSIALKGMESYLKMDVMDPVREASSRFAQIASEKNSSRAKDAAYILARYQTALRILSPYALDGSQLAHDCQKYLSKGELHFAPRR